MGVPYAFLVLAVVAAICTLALGVRGGIFVTIGILIVGVMTYSLRTPGHSTDALMAVGFWLAFGLPFIVGAISLGVLSGVGIRKGRYLLSVLPLLPLVYFVWHTDSGEKNEKNERALAEQFVVNNKELMLLAEGPVKLRYLSLTNFADKTKGEYEALVPIPASGNKFAYAIIEVSRRTRQPEFKLKCVTNLSSGERDVQKGSCSQSIIAVPIWDPESTSQRKLFASIERDRAKCDFPNLKLPSNFAVHVARGSSGKRVDYQIDKSNSQATQIDVSVNSPKLPVVLMLSAYEPNIWNISWIQGTNILAVLASGYYRPAVAGLPKQIPVFLISTNYQEACNEINVDFERPKQVEMLAIRFLKRGVDDVHLVKNGMVTIGPADFLPSQLLTSADTPPASLFDRSAPRAGDAGIQDAIKQGLLRKITEVDIAPWLDIIDLEAPPNKLRLASDQNIENLLKYSIDSGYVVVGAFVFPAGLYGGNSKTFLIPKSVPFPSGNRGHSTILDFNTLQCIGSRCPEEK